MLLKDDFCPQCHRFMISPDNHVCPNQWQARFQNSGEDFVDCPYIYEHSATDAAETFVQRYFESGDSDGQFTTRLVEVRDVETPNTIYYCSVIPDVRIQCTAYIDHTIEGNNVDEQP